MKKVIIGVVIVLLAFFLETNITKADYARNRGDTNVYFLLKNGKGNSLGTIKIAKNDRGEPLYPLNTEKTVDFNYFNEIFTDNFSNFGLTEEQIKKLQLYSHYGYGYRGRTENYWYALTILQMWQVVYPDLTYQITDKTHLKEMDTYNQDILDLQQDVQNHESFYPEDYHHPDEEYNTTLQEEIKVGDNYTRVVNSKTGYTTSYHGITLKEEFGNTEYILSERDNELNVTPSKIYLNRRDKYIYFKGASQDKPSYRVKVKPKRGTLKIKFKNEENVHFENNNCYMIDQGIAFKRNYCVKNNEIIIEDFLYGEFSMNQRKASPGFYLDLQEKEFIFDKDHQEIEVIAPIIKGNIDINTSFCKEGICSDKEGIHYEIFDEKGNLVKTILSEEKGNAKASLPFGTYTIVSKNNNPDYEALASFTLDIKEHNISYRISYKSNFRQEGTKQPDISQEKNPSLEESNPSDKNDVKDSLEVVEKDKYNSNDKEESKGEDNEEQENKKEEQTGDDAGNLDNIESDKQESKDKDEEKTNSKEAKKDTIGVTITEKIPIKIPTSTNCSTELKEESIKQEKNPEELDSPLLEKEENKIKEEPRKETTISKDLDVNELEEILPPDTGIKFHGSKLVSVLLLPFLIKKKYF